MSIGAGIDDDEVGAVMCSSLNAIDQRPFVVALEGHATCIVALGQGFKVAVDVGKRGGAIDIGLARAKQIEVGAVQNEDVLRHDGGLYQTDPRFTPKCVVCLL